ncbi:MAG: hypothetical protein ABI609_00425 [Acidobacteriota bacterium]
MPVRKFRSVAEMRSPVHVPGSAELLDAIRSLWAFSDRLAPQRFPPGVYKHRSVEAAGRLAEQWAEENFRRNAALRESDSGDPR